jgi:hypothetical protein
MFIENVQRSAYVVSAVTHLIEGLSLGTLLTLNVERSLIYLLTTRTPTLYSYIIVEQQLILFLKMPIRNKASRFYHLE